MIYIENKIKKHFHGSCLHAEVRFACLREAASAKAGHAGVGGPRAWDISLFGEDYGSAESHRSAEITHWVKPSVLSFLQISG